MRSAARAAARRAAASVASAAGYDLVPRNEYSPIPGAPPTERLAPLVGVDLDTTASFGLLEGTLAPYVSEFDSAGHAAAGFELWNDFYQSVDAELLYAMVRHLKPRRIIEIGCGHSTLVAALACVRNAAEGNPAADFVAVDPRPRVAEATKAAGLARLERVPAERLPLDRFLELDADDLLFVDSSHVVKQGGEVNYLVLDVLPRLREGVVVHFHDIFLPYDYPPSWYERGMYTTEQYLLHAFLVGNRGYEIVFAAHAAARADRPRLEAAIPSLRAREDYWPAAFWLRRTSASS